MLYNLLLVHTMVHDTCTTVAACGIFAHGHTFTYHWLSVELSHTSHPPTVSKSTWMQDADTVGVAAPHTPSYKIHHCTLIIQHTVLIHILTRHKYATSTTLDGFGYRFTAPYKFNYKQCTVQTQVQALSSHSTYSTYEYWNTT